MGVYEQKLKQMEKIIEQQSAILIRGFDGTYKFGIVMEYLAKIFKKKGKNSGEIIREIEDYNLHNIISKYFTKKDIEDKTLRQRYNEDILDKLEKNDYTKFANEYLKELSAVWILVNDFGPEKTFKLSTLATHSKNTKFYVITYNIGFFMAFDFLLKYRDTEFIDRSNKVFLASNIVIMLIENTILPRGMNEVLKIVSSLKMDPEPKKVGDPSRASLMTFLNEVLFKKEIANDIVGLGEEFFQKDVSLEQLISDLEPIIYDFVRYQYNYANKHFSLAVWFRKIMKEIYDFSKTIET